MEYQLENQYLKLRVSSLGAEIQSLKDQEDVEYIWQGDATYWSGRAPHLFPICGGLRDNQAFYRKERLSMPRHGLVRKREFSLQKQTDQELVFSIQPDPDMLEAYPFYFEFRVLYFLENKTLRVSYQVYNKDQELLPFFVGGHPAFRCPLVAGEDFEDYELLFSQDFKATYPACLKDGLTDQSSQSPFPLKDARIQLSYDLFDQDSLILTNIPAKKVDLRSTRSDHGLSLTYHDFDHLILWTSHNQGPFLALEPWNGLSTDLAESDDFEDKAGLMKVPVGQMRQFSYDISIL